MLMLNYRTDYQVLKQNLYFNSERKKDTNEMAKKSLGRFISGKKNLKKNKMTYQPIKKRVNRKKLNIKAEPPGTFFRNGWRVFWDLENVTTGA